MIRYLPNRNFLAALAVLLILALVSLVVFACDEDEVENPDGDTGDLCAFCTDDDTGGGVDDDQADDDATDDDDAWSPDAGGPIISDAYWDPDEVSISDPTTASFHVFLCDEEDDLLAGENWGGLYIWSAGTEQPFLSENPLSLDTWATLLEAGTDCADPSHISVGLNIEGMAPGKYCVDAGVEDGNGNQSEKASNRCYNIVP